MGKTQADEMPFWTVEEYKKCRDAARAKIRPFTSFELLYYTPELRTVEFFALTRGDIDTSAGTSPSTRLTGRARERKPSHR